MVPCCMHPFPLIETETEDGKLSKLLTNAGAGAETGDRVPSRTAEPARLDCAHLAISPQGGFSCFFQF